MLHDDGCDTKIYERLTTLERSNDRADERLKNMEDFAKEIKQDIKVLSKKVTVSEVRLAAIIGLIIFVAKYFLH